MFAHNGAFGENIQEHRRYEWGLHYVLEDYLASDEASAIALPDIASAKDFWVTSHRNYLEERSGADDYMTDCRYIVNVCMALFQYAFMTAAANSKKERIMGSYENTDNHRLVFTRD